MHPRKGWEFFPRTLQMVSHGTARGTVASGVRSAVLQPPLPSWVLAGFTGCRQDLGPWWHPRPVEDIC